MEPQGKEEELEHDKKQEEDRVVCELKERKEDMREIDQEEDSISDDFFVLFDQSP